MRAGGPYFSTGDSDITLIMTSRTILSDSPASTRELLLRAAAEAFHRDGYLGTDTNRIARAAGFAPATFYKHFADKRAALLAVHEAIVLPELRAGAESLVKAASRDARRVVQHLLGARKSWHGVRRSLRLLGPADAEARAGLQQERLGALELFAALRGGASLPGARERDALLLFALEQAGDALAESAEKELRLAPRLLVPQLEQLLAATLGWLS